MDRHTNRLLEPHSRRRRPRPPAPARRTRSRHPLSARRRRCDPDRNRRSRSLAQRMIEQDLAAPGSWTDSTHRNELVDQISLILAARPADTWLETFAPLQKLLRLSPGYLEHHVLAHSIQRDHDPHRYAQVRVTEIHPRPSPRPARSQHRRRGHTKPWSEVTDSNAGPRPTHTPLGIGGQVAAGSRAARGPHGAARPAVARTAGRRDVHGSTGTRTAVDHASPPRWLGALVSGHWRRQCALIAAACSIDLRTDAWRGSVQTPGLSFSSRMSTLVVWLSLGLRSPGVARARRGSRGVRTARSSVARPTRQPVPDRASEEQMDDAINRAMYRARQGCRG
jgi:hypothetical protein